ncbi:hypothetical protein EON65_31455 [archaeon]|nr:MAG: hypothetical protein EON65_31455 [archaeon]
MTSFSTYTLIDRMQLSKCCITSLCPKALLTHSPRSVIVERGGASPISEVIWLPCPFSLNSLDDVDSAPDDDHFASKLCDKGYTIHAIEPKAGSCFVATLIEVFRWRIEKHKIPGSAICVIANELTCTHVLNYLSDIKLGVHNQYLLSKFNVGAVVLIDPPPLHALSTTQGRRNILKRYLVPIQQLKAERKQKTINQTKKVKKVKSRRQLEREKKMPLR